MNLDPRTFIVAIIVGAALMGGGLYAVTRGDLAPSHGRSRWATATLIQALGWVVMGALRGVIPDLVSIVVGNGLILSSLVGYAIALAEFNHQPLRRWWYAVVGLQSGLLAWFTLVSPSLALRVVVISACSATMLLNSAYVLWSDRHRRRASHVFTASLFLLCGLYMTGRALLTLAWDLPAAGNAFAGNLLNSTTYLICYVFGAMVTFGFVLMSTDRSVEQHSRAAEALITSHDLLVKLSNQVPGALYQYQMLLDGRASFPYTSRGFEKIFGVAPEQVRGDASPVTSNIHPGDASAVLTSRRDSARTMQPWHLEYRVALPDRGQRWWLDQANPERLPDGSTLWHGYIADITARKDAEVELAIGKQRQELALFGADLGLWDWDVRSGQASFDARWCAMVGYQVHELEPSVSTWTSLMHPEDAPLVQAVLEPHLRGETLFFESAFRMRHEGGHWVWILARGRVVAWDTDGAPLRMVGTHMDVSTHKEAEDALRAAKAAAEASGLAKSAFLATMSHEIRTPMNGVIGFADLLADTPLNDEQRSYVASIKCSGDALLIIINDILDFSKIEAGMLTVERLAVDMEETLRSVAGLMAPQAHAKQITLRLEYSPALPRALMVDPHRVRQVLVNFVGNAIKFSEGGTVTIRAGERTEAGERVLRLDVIDTGIGIAADQQARLFEAFTQADSSTTRRFGGTGLGLAICKRLIALMGGQVGVESEPGVGSTFWCDLPLLEAAAFVAPDAGPAVTAEGRATSRLAEPLAPAALNLRVLVAEDSSVNQLVVMRVMEKFGCQADLAVNGREAVDLFQTGTYDVVLMDCYMPEMDGFAATVAIRDLERSRPGGGPPVPIIALSASVLDDDRARCLEVGMNDFCVKPIVRQNLLATLRRWTRPRAA